MTIKMKKSTAPASTTVEDIPQIGDVQETAAPVLSAYAVPPKTESFTIAAIAGILASLLFIGLLLMQWLELSYYNQYPPAFPSALSTPAAAPVAAPPAETQGS
jgi:hypothetical protein